MIKNNTKELIKNSILVAINDLNNSVLSDIDPNKTIEELEIFKDSLNVIIFITALESSLCKSFESKIEIDVETLVSQEFGQLKDINDLISFLDNSISI